MNYTPLKTTEQDFKEAFEEQLLTMFDNAETEETRALIVETLITEIMEH